MIRCDLGLLGSGKSHRAFDETTHRPGRFCIYTPLKGEVYERGGHPALQGIPTVQNDTASLAGGFEPIFKKAKGFYVTYQGNSVPFFQAAMGLVDCNLVLDDFSMLSGSHDEMEAFLKFIPRVKWSGINLWTTCHLPAELGLKLRAAADEINWYGPLSDPYTVKFLHGLRRNDYTLEHLTETLKKQEKFISFRIR